MPTITLSSKGQITIPKPMRDAHYWRPGQKFLVIATGEGVLLKPAIPFAETSLAEVAACPQMRGRGKNHRGHGRSYCKRGQ